MASAGAKSSSAPEKDRGEGTGTRFSPDTKYTVVNKVTCYTEILSHPRCQEMQVNGRAMYMSAGREVTFEDILPNVQGLNKWQGKQCTMGLVKASYHGTDHNVWVICAETNMKAQETRTEYNFMLSNTLEASNARKKLADNERQQLEEAGRYREKQRQLLEEAEERRTKGAPERLQECSSAQGSLLRISSCLH